MKVAPVEADIGRKVVYRDPYGPGPEEGVLTGISVLGADHRMGGVYVRYGSGVTSQLTPIDRLEWIV